MRDDKEMNVQINEYQKLLEYLKAKGMSLLEEFAAGVLIEKFPDSWSDYKKNLKHKQKNFTNGKIVTDILIEDSNRKESAKASMAALKENSVESSSSNRKRYKNKSQGYKPKNPNLKRKKGSCFIVENQAIMPHTTSTEQEMTKKTNTPKANLVDGADIIVVVISQVNIIVHAKEWVVHSGATRHICANREVFSSYTPLEDDREEVYLGDSSTTKVLGKGKFLLKLTSGKFLALVDVFHVPTMRANLISVSLLGRAGVKVPFEFDKIIMTKNNVCMKGLFITPQTQGARPTPNRENSDKQAC
uniref:Retrovirus-related Pol polyprotein from transposon TNT 1-94-like beta-barrel domain-containing protein n=2 Tax=Nicotiana TaxID=4085 RepID=A0A1S3Y2N9_TOBAC|nr:PREDICTED: uncharacterized protein LOC104238579 [Nicotiana sylvestris]XP_016446468.1 PREDICTED: uncharacterized protein LOC107771575 [Nicotiana tabacum]